MTKAEKFIRDHTNRCSNEFVGGGYHEWLTPEEALRAVEIAKEELMNTAIDADICSTDVMTPLITLDEKRNKYPDLRFGDKVRIIILPNE